MTEAITKVITIKMKKPLQISSHHLQITLQLFLKYKFTTEKAH